MKGAVLYGPRDIRFVEREDPKIVEPTDVIIRMSATCVCGSDLWPYRGVESVLPTDANGPRVRRHRRGGRQRGRGHSEPRPVRRRLVLRLRQHLRHLPGRLPEPAASTRQYVGAGGAQAACLRVPLADGTLVATPEVPSDDLIPSLLAASDVLGTGWFGAVAAEVGPGKTVAVVGDGAVGLLARARRQASSAPSASSR